MSKLRVAIDCRIVDPHQGVGTALLALAHGLNSLENVDQEYTFIVYDHVAEWIRPYVGESRILTLPYSKRSKLRRFASKASLLRNLWRRLSKSPSGDRLAETEGFDVIHFPSQVAYMTKIPSIYQPWDLQHLHYPEYFTEREIDTREFQYRAYCKQAHFICVQTEWGKRDIAQQYGISPEKIRVIRYGSAFEVYKAPSSESVDKCLAELNIPASFFVFPAITWPHKNHEVIFRAMDILKQRHREIPNMVFTGGITPFHDHLWKLALSLGIEKNIYFLGFVSSDQIQAIYRAAKGMIFPSKFEGLGLPVLEAFRAGLPVICSNATVLPEVAGEGALFFAPDSPAQLADLVEKLEDSKEFRLELQNCGRESLKKYSVFHAAEEFAELYRETASKSRQEK